MFRRVGPVALLLAAAAGCSNPPTKEHDQAQAAIAAARTADAAVYASEDLLAAQASLDKYDQAVQQGDYRQALSDAIEARDRAYEAARQSGVQKAAARTELQTAIAQLDGLLKTAAQRLAAPAAPHLAPAAADHLRVASRTATEALQEARTRMDAEHYREGLAGIQPAIDELQKASAPADGAHRGRGAQ